MKSLVRFALIVACVVSLLAAWQIPDLLHIANALLIVYVTVNKP